MAQTSAQSASNSGARHGMTHQVKLIATVAIITDSDVLYVEMDNGPDLQSGLFLPNDVLAKVRTRTKQQSGLQKSRLVSTLEI